MERVLDLTAGLPFLVEELVAAGGDTASAPATFAADLLGSRILALSDDARRLVEVAAVAGDPSDPHTVFGACGLDDDSFDVALAEVRAAGVLLVGQAGDCRFRHALLREAALAQVPPAPPGALAPRLRAVDRGAGGAVTGDGGRARHPLAGGRRPRRALTCTLTAVEEAARANALHERLRLLRLALDLCDELPADGPGPGVDPADLLADAAEIGYLLDSTAVTRDSLRRARVVTSPGDEPRLAWLDLIACWLRWQENEGVGTEEMREVVDRLRGQPPGRHLVLAVQTLSNALLQDGDPHAALPLAQEGATLAEEVGDEALVAKGLGQRGLVQAALGDFPAALRSTAADRAVADRVGDLIMREEALMGESVVRWHAGDWRGAQEAARQAQELLGGPAGPRFLPLAWRIHTLNLVEGLVDSGAWGEAEAQLQVVEQQPDLSAWTAGWCQRLRLWLCTWRGEVDPRAFRPTAEGEHLTDARVRLQDSLPDVCTLADVLALLGRTDEARAHARPVLWRPRVEQAYPSFLWQVLMVLARIEADAVAVPAATGAAPLAGAPGPGGPDRVLVDRIAELAQGLATPGGRDTMAAQVRADLAVAGGRPDVQRCRDALACWDEAEMPHWQAWSWRRLGLVAAERQERDLARAALERSLRGAETLGAVLLAERVRGEARELGLRLRGTVGGAGVSGAAGGEAHLGAAGLGMAPPDQPLTAREREVLAMLAEGASNGDIAQELVISRKTVSVHVSHLLAKLDAVSRGQAVAHARRAGLLDQRRAAPPT